MSALSSEVLPEPFAPSTTQCSPGPTVHAMRSRIVVLPRRIVRSRTARIGAFAPLTKKSAPAFPARLPAPWAPSPRRGVCAAASRRWQEVGSFGFRDRAAFVRAQRRRGRARPGFHRAKQRCDRRRRRTAAKMGASEGAGVGAATGSAAAAACRFWKRNLRVGAFVITTLQEGCSRLLGFRPRGHCRRGLKDCVGFFALRKGE